MSHKSEQVRRASACHRKHRFDSMHSRLSIDQASMIDNIDNHSDEVFHGKYSKLYLFASSSSSSSFCSFSHSTSAFAFQSSTLSFFSILSTVASTSAMPEDDHDNCDYRYPPSYTYQPSFCTLDYRDGRQATSAARSRRSSVVLYQKCHNTCDKNDTVCLSIAVTDYRRAPSYVRRFPNQSSPYYYNRNRILLIIYLIFGITLLPLTNCFTLASAAAAAAATIPNHSFYPRSNATTKVIKNNFPFIVSSSSPAASKYALHNYFHYMPNNVNDVTMTTAAATAAKRRWMSIDSHLLLSNKNSNNNNINNNNNNNNNNYHHPHKRIIIGNGQRQSLSLSSSSSASIVTNGLPIMRKPYLPNSMNAVPAADSATSYRSPHHHNYHHNHLNRNHHHQHHHHNDYQSPMITNNNIIYNNNNNNKHSLLTASQGNISGVDYSLHRYPHFPNTTPSAMTTVPTVSACDRWISSDNGTMGTFTSPNFPQPYPAMTRCSYHFVGHGKQRVQIIFDEFDIQKVEDQHRDCETSDSVTAYIHTNGQREWIKDFCGDELPPRLMSNGPRLTIDFKSLKHNALGAKTRRRRPGVSSSRKVKPTKSYIAKSAKSIKGKKVSETAKKKAKTKNGTKIGKQWNSLANENIKNENSNYLNEGAENETKYAAAKSIEGEENEENEDEDEDDEVEEEEEEEEKGDVTKNDFSKIENYLSPSHFQNDQMRSAPSHGNATGRRRARLAKGFRATYRFVTNFGVESGRQDSKSVCGFVYNSTVSKTGIFTSPNFPGLYPKDTECHYFFYANSTERIVIEFTHFDVEGVTPCTLETASDYVEFAHVALGERKLYRHCGLKHPQSVESEADYFRVTFKSNGRFDGTGFRAIYSFRNTQSPAEIPTIAKKPTLIKKVSTSMSTSSADSIATMQCALLYATLSLFAAFVAVDRLQFEK